MTPEDVRRHIGDRIPSGSVAVALSGGADSAVLAWAVSDRSGVSAITIDHGLPGSAALVAAATAIAKLLGLAHRVTVVYPRSDSEGDLREVRLAALGEVKEDWILLGHTADDPAVWLLGNLLGGAGTAGLAGIRPQRDRFVRPLLDIARRETRRLATLLDLPFVDDPQNDDLSIRRNRIRTETLPALAAAYNPSLQDALLRSARAAVADDDVLDERAARVPVHRDEEAVLIPAAALTTLPAAVATRVVRRALRIASGPHAGDEASVQAVIAAAFGVGVATIRGGLDVHREGPWVVVAGPPPPPPVEVMLSTPGSAQFGPWTITAGVAGVPVPVGGPVVVRAAIPGDRISIGSGTKVVAEVLREAGVPVRLRSRWPVVEEHGRIAWVVGIRVAPAVGSAVTMSATRESR